MTLEIVITSQRHKKVTVLLGSGSEKKYVLKSMAKELGLQTIFSETVAGM